MSMNTPYYGYVHRWTTETWDNKLKEQFGDNDDINSFLDKFADPRIIWSMGYAMKVKDDYFNEFKAWAVAKGYPVTKPEPTFMSMSFFAGEYKLSIEDIEKIESITFKKK